MHNKSITSWQVKIFLLCWLAYTSAYLCRTNLAIAMPAMMNAYGWDKTSVGLIGSLFFWTYAVGQLINGIIGDKAKARSFIFIGLCGSAITNLIVGQATNLTLIIVLWGLNGFFLSMLWGPIMKTFSYWFSHEKRTRIAIGISTSMIAGYLIAWGIIGHIIAHTSWQWAFKLPGIIVLTYAFIWLWQMRNHPQDVGFISPNKLLTSNLKEEKANKTFPSLWKIIIASNLLLIALVCICETVLKEGITQWGPTFLKETHHLTQQSLASLSLLVPFMSFFGILFAGWLNKKFNLQEKVTIMVLLGLGSLSCLGMYLILDVNLYASTTFLGCASSFMYGADALLFGVIPLHFAKYNKVSGVAGFLDFCSYMGVGLAGFLTGLISSNFGWRSIIILWALLTLIGMISMGIAYQHEKKCIMMRNYQPKSKNL